MTLGDVAVDLTQEEWGLVGPAPKTLYQDVMLETFGHLDIVSEAVLYADLLLWCPSTVGFTRLGVWDY